MSFLPELADLLDKYDVAICSRQKGNYSEVYYTLDYFGLTGKTCIELKSGRHHSTAYDIRLLAGMAPPQYDFVRAYQNLIKPELADDPG